mgnify:FL=1
MKSPVINDQQMTLSFEGGLVDRYGCLREVVATGIYQRGLKRTAIDLDTAPSNLSVKLSDDPSRSFSVELLEKYIETSGDMTPIYYLVEKFLRQPDATQSAALAQLGPILAQLAPLMRQAGLTT